MTLLGVGKIPCREWAGRMARNPAAGEQVSKPAGRLVTITVAKTRKGTINA